MLLSALLEVGGGNKLSEEQINFLMLWTLRLN